MLVIRKIPKVATSPPGVTPAKTLCLVLDAATLSARRASCAANTGKPPAHILRLHFDRSCALEETPAILSETRQREGGVDVRERVSNGHMSNFLTTMRLPSEFHKGS